MLICGVVAFLWLALRRRSTNRVVVAVRAASAFLAVAAAVWAGVDTVGFTADAHGWAARLLFAGLVGVVVVHYRVHDRYKAVLWAMGVTLALWTAALLIPDFTHLTLFGELALIGEFLWFWRMQSRQYGLEDDSSGDGSVTGDRAGDSAGVQ